MALPLVSAAGFATLIGVGWLLSAHRGAVAWRTVAWGVGLQVIIGLLVFRVPFSQEIFLWLNEGVLALLGASKSAITFLFGPLGLSPGEPGSIGFILLFQVLPVAIFFSAFTALLYHLRILQLVVRGFAKVFHRTMRVSGAESLCGASNIFVGVESALVVRPYLANMTRSELLTVLGAGMATVASSTLGIYVAMLGSTFPQIGGHLLSASVISIPAAVLMTKLLLPETEQPETLASIPPDDESLRARSAMSAVIQGSMDGLRLAAGIAALLIAVLGLVALADKILLLPSGWFGLETPLSLVRILSWVFHPFALLLGIAPSDVPEAARLLGQRAILTEVLSYQDLAAMIAAGELSDPRTVVIMSYALCGFAHVASVAIFVGGTAALIPGRRDDLGSLGMRALLAATLATLMTGCIAGIFSGGQATLLLRPPV